jgi:hypothetical protein
MTIFNVSNALILWQHLYSWFLKTGNQTQRKATWRQIRLGISSFLKFHFWIILSVLIIFIFLRCICCFHFNDFSYVILFWSFWTLVQVQFQFSLAISCALLQLLSYLSSSQLSRPMITCLTSFGISESCIDYISPGNF